MKKYIEIVPQNIKVILLPLAGQESLQTEENKPVMRPSHQIRLPFHHGGGRWATGMTKSTM